MTSTEFFDEVYRRYRDAEGFMAGLRARLKQHGISQGSLARRSGYHPTHVSRWFSTNPKTHVKPTMETMVVLDEAAERLVIEREARRREAAAIGA